MSYDNLSATSRISLEEIRFILSEESIPRTEGMAHASGVESSGVILSDLVNTVPLMLYGLPIARVGTCFSLPRVGTPLFGVAPTDTPHVSLFLLYLGFSLSLCLLSISFAL